MTVSNHYEIEFDGTMICDGDKLTILEFEVWESPEIRSSDKPRGQQDGLFPGLDFYGERTITLKMEVWGETQLEFKEKVDTLRRALRKTDVEKVLEFQLPEWTYNLISNCRCRAVRGPIVDLNHEFSVGELVVQFVSTDPRLYDATEANQSTGFIGVQSGRTYDLTFNRSFGGVVSSNSIFATNEGNYDTPFRAVINGPVTNPSIEHVGLGKTIQILGEVADGDFLEIAGPPYNTVMLNGTATRFVWLANSDNWFQLAPGSNEIRFNGSSAGSPTLDLYWRTAWV